MDVLSGDTNITNVNILNKTNANKVEINFE